MRLLAGNKLIQKIIKVLNLKGGNTKMKKFISLALAAAMTLSLVPVSAFAATYNSIDKTVTVTKDTVLGDDTAPTITIENDKNHFPTSKAFEFGLKLDGAEFSKDGSGNAEGVTATIEGNAPGTATVTYVSSTYAMVEVPAGAYDDTTVIKIDLGQGAANSETGVKVTGDTAKVTIDPKNSTVSADTFTIAKGVDGSVLASIEKTTDIEDGTTAIKDIILEETVAGSIETGKEITFKLNSGFKFVDDPDFDVVSGNVGTPTIVNSETDERTRVYTAAAESTSSSILRLQNIKIAPDGADIGDVAEITISGAGISKTTIEVGTFVDFGVTVKTEDKDLPIIYSGVDYQRADSDNETLELTVKENVVASWLTGNRKTTFTFPEGVDVVGLTVEDESGFVSSPSDGGNKIDSKGKIGDFTVDSKNNNVVTFDAGKATDADNSKKAELVLKFNLNVAPDFTGDISCKVGGPAIGEEQEVKLAKAVAPIKVETEKTSVAIDYRNVSVADITLTEAEAGLWQKNQTITLDVDNMQFESGIKAEVVEGDGEIKKLDISKKDGTVTLTVDSESSKTPMKVKLSNVSLYLDRSLPAGDYSLSLVSNDPAYDVMFEVYNKDDEAIGKFDVDSVEVMKDYVTVATAGRDQGTTFTTEVAVTIDATTMLVDGAEKTLDVPAYLSAEGWTMLPVRAVTEALATTSNSQPIDWIAGNPGTIMIYYGDKTVAMTLGSTTMYINGTPVPMSTAPVIVNDRAFLPMRDLGRALGLSDDQIKWDATTRTATFNPAATTTTK